MEKPTSKLTSKYQATIPEPVRKMLNLQAGDMLAFEIEGDDVCLRKATSVDMAFTRSLDGTMSEWLSDADEEAYRDL